MIRVKIIVNNKLDVKIFLDNTLVLIKSVIPEMIRNRLLIWSQMNQLLNHYDQQNKPVLKKSIPVDEIYSDLIDNYSEDITGLLSKVN